MNKFQFEVCANSVESCLAAQKGGANRVELCAGIPEGGTTPSYGEISVAREVLDATRLHVIIRPRGGDFLYSPIEVKAMLKDIEMAKQLKADGVVFGCLTAEGEIDLTIMQELMKAAQGLSVTFHRAFDVCRDPKKALEQSLHLAAIVFSLPVNNQLPNQASLCSKNYKSKRQEGLSYLQDAASMKRIFIESPRKQGYGNFISLPVKTSKAE